MYSEEINNIFYCNDIVGNSQLEIDWRRFAGKKPKYNDSHVIQKSRMSHVSSVCPNLQIMEKNLPLPHSLIFLPSINTNCKVVIAIPPTQSHTSYIKPFHWIGWSRLPWPCCALVTPSLLLLHFPGPFFLFDYVKCRGSHRSQERLGFLPS